MAKESPITIKVPPLYPKQHAAFFGPERIGVIEASTKSGKTAAGHVWLIAAAVAMPGMALLWLSPIYAQAKMQGFDRMLRMLVRADPQAESGWTCNRSELWIQLANGSRIWFKGADHPDSIYGADYAAALVDESTRCKTEAWHAVRSTLTATQGKVRIIGNVKGRQNWAYQLARQAEAGEPDMAYHRLTALDAVDAGIFPQEEFDAAKRILPDHVFRELYLAEPSDDGGNPFGLDAIRSCVADIPLSTRPEWFGVDLAKSQDWTVVCGLNTVGEVVVLERWQSTWPETMDRILRTVGNTPTLVDSTGVGDPVLDQLQKRRYGVFEGFKFSAQSKQQLMEGLAAAIQQQAVRFEDGWLVNELEAFEYEYTRTGVRYSAPAGLHDDGVCALALAIRHRQQRAVVNDADIRLIGADVDDWTLERQGVWH